MYNVVVKKFTFVISSPDEFLVFQANGIRDSIIGSLPVFANRYLRNCSGRFGFEIDLAFNYIFVVVYL